MKKSNSLAESYPDIAAQWDYKKNGNLTPDDVSAGSNLDVYWICNSCHQSYKKKICNRTSPSRINNESIKCPICLGRVIIPGYNSLKAKFPDIVDKEWDYELNSKDPDNIPPHTNIKYWWKCHKGHQSYQASPNNKISGTGGNCPYCSHQKLTKENSLAYANPKLAQDWCYEKNKTTPEKVFVNSNISVFWKCKYGHVWRAKINNRNNGKGCPVCAKGHHSSFPEQAIYYYLKMAYNDAINGYKHHKDELDIFIPSLQIGIEYDGEYYHGINNKLIRDTSKGKRLTKDGITLIRIREEGCPDIYDGSIIYKVKYTNDYIDLNRIIQELLNYLFIKSGTRLNINVNIDTIREKILTEISTVPLDKSLLIVNPLVASECDYSKNKPLLPEQVFPNSSRKAYWKCIKCGYSWKAVIGSRNQGFGCPRCAGCERYSTEEWIKKAKVIHGEKYIYSKVEYINNKTPITIICPKHGEFTQIPSEHLSGKGCSYCAHQSFHTLESLANIAPNIANDWDYELNKESGYTPETILATNCTLKFYWHCNNGKPHSYQATCSSRIKRHTGCAVCHGKQIAFDTSLAYKYPELALEWCKFNKIKPSEVSCGSEIKVWWKCSNELHLPYMASIYSRVHLHSGCPECSGNKKYNLSYEQELTSRFPNIELLTGYSKSKIKVKCRCKKCGYVWESYPLKLLNRKTGCVQCASLTKKKSR